jgi:hypothetical protein
MTIKYLKKSGVNLFGKSFVFYVNNETGALFPESLENKDYLEFLEWVQNGNQPIVEELPPPSCETQN